MATVFHGAAPVKPFAWSYSKLKNFESCPKKHYEVDVLKRFKDESEALTYGNQVHALAAKRLSGGVPLPVGYDELEDWCARILGTGGGKVHTELKLAITMDFAPCAWFDRQAWFRGVADVLKVMGDVGLAVDWKTGKNIIEDSVQLALMSACVFAHYPEVNVLRTKFIWLGHNAETSEDYKREDMPMIWKNLWPRIEALEHAHKTTTYPAKPGRLCRRWCPVTECPHHGNGS